MKSFVSFTNNALFVNNLNMHRRVIRQLEDWLHGPRRRPLVLRGARQVGKTWLARELARRAGRELVEVDFERDPGHQRFFGSNDPTRIIDELSLALDQKISPTRSLLFLDEIQNAGKVLAKLRWFYEEMPELPVVAAGSLLEFTLADHRFSMPVGRVEFLHIEPMDFAEYLEAHDQQRLLQVLADWRPSQDLPLAAHERATEWFERFLMVGGMPGVVTAEVDGATPAQCRDLQRQLVATYRADFAKYGGRVASTIIDQILVAVAGSIGHKFVYAQAGAGVKGTQAKRALELLASARLCHLVRYSSVAVPPLAAGVKDSFRKAILVDVGLLHAQQQTPAGQAFPAWSELPDSLRGRLAEQVAGQHLRLLGPMTGDGPSLYYWQREGGRPGEIDYLVQVGMRVVPIELKAGAAGSMKSLHQYMYDKHLDLAVRCDRNPPGRLDLEVKTTQGNDVQYRLLNLPHYLLWNLGPVLESVIKTSLHSRIEPKSR